MNHFLQNKETVMKTLLKSIALSALVMSAYSANADDIANAVMNEHRSAEAKARDEYRHPQQTLRFFGIQSDMKVVEIWPGGGWYADILAPMLKEKGEYVAAHFYVDEDSHEYYKKALAGFKEKVKSHPPYANVAITAFHPVKALQITEPGSADVVLTFRNLHNWYMREGEAGLDNAFGAFFNALKSGGVLGIVEHEMPETGTDEAMEKSGYMKRSLVLAAARKAGFELEASSAVNANEMDNAEHPNGVWTLPPTLALGEQDQDKYLSIGESNRMTLKFVKP